MKKKSKEVLLRLGKINKMHTLLALFYMSMERQCISQAELNEIDRLYEEFMKSANTVTEATK